MGQKVNPLSFRLQTSKAWNSRWFASKKDFAVWLAEDGKIRSLIEKKFSSRPTIAKVEIERSANLVTITIYTAKAGVAQEGNRKNRQLADSYQCRRGTPARIKRQARRRKHRASARTPRQLPTCCQDGDSKQPQRWRQRYPYRGCRTA